MSSAARHVNRPPPSSLPHTTSPAMSRQSAIGQSRALSLTEELEKLEQSITLTLQEIDHNFSRAHRIVTSSILPIVEQYGNHSRDVWEGSSFWKQFFESSANVSLSGYEEQPSTLERQDETVTEDTNNTTHTTLETSNTYDTPTAQHISTDSIQDIDLSNLTLSPSHSTPRAVEKTFPRAQTAIFSQDESHYEQQDVTGTINPSTFQQRPPAPETPGKRPATYGDDMTPQSSPFLPPQPTSIPRPSTQLKKNDPLLHRVLDRNYRVQATPLTTSRHTNRLPQQVPDATPTTKAPNRTQQLLADDSILSSPEPAAPELHAEIFSSPQRKLARTPGVSVLTPAANRTTKNKTPIKSTASIWDDTDDLDDDLDEFGQSPPKTMQFHIPQRRLLKTPAKEASQRIVQELLDTARVGGHDEFTDDFDLDLKMDDSPSVVRQAAGLEDETF